MIMMNKTMITAVVAALAMTATAADARQSARQRGVASGQEAKERMATKNLNAQQLAGNMAMPASAAMAPTTAMPPSDTTGTAAPAPEAMPMAPATEAMPATDAMPATPPVAPEPR